MRTSTPNAPARLSQRSHAQRRLRRSTANRLYCTTNGCTTLLVPDVTGEHARCPVCGLQRRLRPQVPAFGAL